MRIFKVGMIFTLFLLVLMPLPKVVDFSAALEGSPYADHPAVKVDWVLSSSETGYVREGGYNLCLNCGTKWECNEETVCKEV